MRFVSLYRDSVCQENLPKKVLLKILILEKRKPKIRPFWVISDLSRSFLRLKSDFS